MILWALNLHQVQAYWINYPLGLILFLLNCKLVEYIVLRVLFFISVTVVLLNAQYFVQYCLYADCRRVEYVIPWVSLRVFKSVSLVRQQISDYFYFKVEECSYLLVLHFKLRWRAATKPELSSFPLLAVDIRTAMQYYGRYSGSIYIYFIA
jgi:hypothetical protein